MLASLVAAFALAAAEPAPAAAAPAADDVTAQAVYVDEGVLLDALNALLEKGREPGRIAVYVDDANAGRRVSLERSMVRALRDRRREDVVTPSLVKATLDAAAQKQLEGGDGTVMQGLAADHVIVADVVDEGGKAVLKMRLLYTPSAAVLGSVSVDVEGAAQATTARAVDVRTAAADLVDVLAEGVESRGVDVKSHRVAIPAAVATGAAKEARLDRFIQSELTAALRERGFLIVERAQLQTAMDQMAIQEMTDTGKVAELGQILGAQSIVLAQVAEAGTSFVISARLVSVSTSDVLSAASASVVRDDVVSIAAIETRTPTESAVRSAVAPGWGQAFNGEGVKAVLFGVSTYASLATTVGLGIGAGASWAAYNGITVENGSSAAEAAKAGQDAINLRQQTNGLLTATAVAGAVTATVWSLNVVDALLSAPTD